MVDTLTQIADLVNPEVNAPIVQYELEKALRFTPLVKVKKAGKGTQITDEAVLSGYGDPIGESNRQLGLALANKIDDDLLTAAKAGKQKVTDIEMTVDGLETALAVFPDDSDDSQVVFVVNKKNAMKLRRDAQKQMAGSDVGANAVIANTRYAVEGVQIVETNKLGDTEGILLIKKLTTITADEHYAAYLYNDSKVVVATIKASATASEGSR